MISVALTPEICFLRPRLDVVVGMLIVVSFLSGANSLGTSNIVARYSRSAENCGSQYDWVASREYPS